MSRRDLGTFRPGEGVWSTAHWRSSTRCVQDLGLVGELINGYDNGGGLEHTLKVIGADRVLYSVDYPYEDTREANNWFEALELDESDKMKIAYDNAARLLKIR